MSAATATADAAPKIKKGKKMLLIIVAAVLLLAIAGGGGAVYLMKKRAAEAAAAEEAEGDEPAAAHAEAGGHGDKAVPPVFMPLDPFTVNLADRDSERYAQVGVTLEMEDQHAADEMKAYMPAVRNNILLVLADKTAADLMAREGKEKLAREIRREALKPLGFKLELEEEPAHVEGQEAKPKKKKKEPTYPVRAVQFSNFIIQ